MTSKHDKEIHKVFEISILIKGFYAIVEIVGGFLILYISRDYVVDKVLAYTQEELSKDPKDYLAHYLISLSDSFSISSQHFISFYLLGHGIVKLILVIGLFKKKIWAYPGAMLVFSFFVIYQLYRYTDTHSIWLLILTVFDLLLIGLTAYEYKHMKANALFIK